MLGEFVRLLTGRDRRTEPRREVRFPVWWLKGDHIPVGGQGVEISHAGLAFVLPVPVKEREINIAFDLPARRIKARIELHHGTSGTSGGKTVYRYGARFTGIASDDWDAVVRFVKNLPEPTNKAAEETAAIQHRDDDAYRLLPLVVQRKIIDMLVGAHRLARPHNGQPPLLKMRYVGQTKRMDGTTVVRVRVHSRVRDVDETRTYETPFAIGDDGSVIAEG